MNCPQCGTKNPDDFVFCLQCGERLEPPRVEPFGSEAARPDQIAQTIADPIPLPDAHPPMSGGARLTVEQGSVDQREFELNKPAISIGRRVGNDIVVRDNNVSRQHARVIRQADGFVLEDCDSANGTLVNDERVEGSRRLHSGDSIRVGDALFVFHETAAVEPDEGMNTVAMESDWPMTTIGPPIDVEPPAALSSPPVATPAVSPAGPLTPPPAIMDQSQTTDQPHTTFAERVDEPEEEPEYVAPPGESREAAPPPSPKSSDVQPSAGAEALAAIQRDLSELNRDLGAFASSVAGLVERVERLERSLAEMSSDLGRQAEAARSAATGPLREFSGLAEAAAAAGGPERLEPLIELLDKLTAQPRDIELLLQLSQQVATLEEVLRLHLRLVNEGPKVREALGRIAG